MHLAESGGEAGAGRIGVPPVKRLLVVFGLLAIALAGLRIGLLNDATIAKSTAKWLGTKLARSLVVNGDADILWGNPLRIRASRVELSNPPWAEDPLMARAAELEVAVDLTSLRGDQPLLLTELIIRDLEGELVRNEDGDANWQFGDPDGDGGANFVVRELHVTNGKLRVRRPDFEPVDITIAELAQTENADGLLETTLLGSYNDRPVTATGQVGPFRNLIAGRNVGGLLRASLGTLKIDGFGTIDDLNNPRQPELRLNISAPDAIEVASMLGIDFNRPSDIELALRIDPADTGISFTAGGRWATTNLDFRGVVRDLPTLDGVELQATGDGNDLQGFLRLFGAPSVPQAPFRFAGDLTRDGQRMTVRDLEVVVGGHELQLSGDLNRFPSLNDANLSLNVVGDDLAAFKDFLGMPGVAAGEFDLRAKLARSGSGEDLFQLRARTALGHGTIDGTLASAPGYVGTRMSVEAGGVSLGPLSRAFLQTELSNQPFAVTGEIEVEPTGFRLSAFRLDSGETVLQGDGLLTNDPQWVGTKLTWSITDLDLAQVGRLAGSGQTPARPMLWPSRPVSASGTSLIRPDDFLLEEVAGTVGDDEFTLSGQLGRGDGFRGTDLNVVLRGPGLHSLAFLIGQPDLPADPRRAPGALDFPAGPFQLSGRLRRTARGISVSGSRLEVAGASGNADIELALPADPLNARFNIEIRGTDAARIWQGRHNINFGTQPFSVDLRGTANRTLVQLDNGVLRVGEDKLTLSGQVGRGDQFRGTDLDMVLQGPDLERLALRVGQPDRGRAPGALDFPAGPFQLSGRLRRTARGMSVSGSRLEVAGAAGKADIDLALPASPLDARFDIRISGSNAAAVWKGRYNIEFGEKPFSVNLRGAYSDQLLQLDDGMLNVGESELQATGKIRRGGHDNAVTIRATSPEIADIAKVFGIELFPGRDLQLTGTLRRRGELFRLENFLAKSNKGDLAGNLQIKPGQPLRIAGELTSQFLDIGWLRQSNLGELLEKPTGANSVQRDGRLIPDWPLPLDALKRINLDLSVSAEQVRRERHDVRNNLFRLVIQDGALHLAPYRFAGDSGTLDAELHVVPDDNGATVRFLLTANDLVTGLFQPDNADVMMLPAGNWEIDLRGTGRTLRQVAGNLTGRARLSSSAGRLSNQGRTNALFGDLLTNICLL
mgnify:FL=1